MLKNRKLLIAVLAVILMGALVFSACDSSSTAQPLVQNKDRSGKKTQSSDTLSGSITIAGSTAMQPLVEAAAEKFMELYPNVSITVQGGGSGTGLSQVLNGAADIGDSDVFAEEKLDGTAAGKLLDHQVIAQGYAAIVNREVHKDNLTKSQLTDIFTGKVTNWKDVGGENLKIVVINRPRGSGTRSVFVKKALDGANVIEGDTLTGDSNGTVLAEVNRQPGAISYLGLEYLDGSVKALKIDGSEASVDNIIKGTYPVWSFGHMYTKGELAEPVKSFLEFMASNEVSQIAGGMKYIAGSDINNLN